MNARQREIVGLLEQFGEITVRDLASRLKVSAMTIHRDLDYLEDNNYLYKKRGAAVFINGPDRSLSHFYEAEKRAIGRAAAGHVRSGQSVLFDNSTTAIEAARYLCDTPGVTFYTTNIEVANIVCRYPNTVLYCSGGYYFPDSRGFTGPQAEAFVAGLQADVCLIGASGISIDGGLTNPYPMHTVLQRRIIEASRRRIVLADHSKFGKRAMERAAALSEIDLIITDSGIPRQTLEEYRKHVRIETV